MDSWHTGFSSSNDKEKRVNVRFDRMNVGTETRKIAEQGNSTALQEEE